MLWASAVVLQRVPRHSRPSIWCWTIVSEGRSGCNRACCRGGEWARGWSTGGQAGKRGSRRWKAGGVSHSWRRKDLGVGQRSWLVVASRWEEGVGQRCGRAGWCGPSCIHAHQLRGRRAGICALRRKGRPGIGQGLQGCSWAGCAYARGPCHCGGRSSIRSCVWGGGSADGLHAALLQCRLGLQGLDVVGKA